MSDWDFSETAAEPASSYPSREGGRGRGRGRGRVGYSRNDRNDDSQGDSWGGGGEGDNGYNGNGDGEREGGGRVRGRGGRGGGRGRFNDRQQDGGDGGNSFGDDEQPPVSDKPRPTYIPAEINDDDISCSIDVGTNFDKYQNIDVKVSGDSVPKHIENFKSSGLREVLIDNLTACNYTTPTPIQKYALPIIMNGRDMMASAQTGSGKTAAFVLPILHTLLSEPNDLVYERDYCEPQCVIMAPTRELAIQIREVVYKLAKGTVIKHGLLYGGTATGYQKSQIVNGVHIIVATPGRLNDFVGRGIVSFKSVRFFVLDEADRMLDMGFKPDIERILDHETMVDLNSRQTLLFSATLADDIQMLAKKFLKPNYAFVAVGEIGGACKDVVQEIREVSKFEKKKELIKVLQSLGDISGTMVFVEQKRNADFIAAFLSEKDYPTTSIHGDREQPEREQALRDFKNNKMKILVATAVAARGLDIKGVNCVINFDMPSTIDEYVHRIGRTGRLGNSGRAVSFYDGSSDSGLSSELVRILKQAEQEVPSFLSGGSYGGGNDYDGQSSFNDIRSTEPAAGGDDGDGW
ncbi:ATP-dependent RNA helicase vasa-like isoform X2 [Adelges cooleyi]|nr:ATP-dependent RNA helicase vasa-like isoform X2 [Adelges cooleyi]XP_050425963.1 ATP-dependent RNA helicase vasa-like isoform X2 [Adelges cooleyi]XP_050425964.1 ATP-dependent RNA helicase vasa-like isoform X2 [Adelges cooleyi]XP_050425965.1 ATP-dependent RNA helicase vasa-like isoform X2 [Adelges cooleyi]